MFVYRKSSLSVAEVFFHAGANIPPVDIIRFQSQLDPVQGAACSEFHTLWLDLTRDSDQLMAGMSSTARQQLRKAAGDGFEYEISASPDQEWFNGFIAAYDEFASGRSLPPANRARLGAMREYGLLCLTRVREAEGPVLTWHCYLRQGDRSRLMHSVSSHRPDADKRENERMARANRLCHWRDILTFQEQGQKIYDLGGWYTGEEDKAKLGINAYKKSYGGEVVQLYNADRGVTLKGALAIQARRALSAWRGEEK